MATRIIALIVFVLVALSWALCLILAMENPQAGGIDPFAALNVLFSGLAFTGVVLTVLLQREELRATRDELKGQRLQMEQQNRTLRVQQFETTFSNLMSLFSGLVREIDVNNATGRKDTGRDAILSMFRDLGGDIMKEEGDMSVDRVVRAYEKFYQRRQGDLGHYFRVLYNLVKFVDGSEVGRSGPYASLIRAQLSNQELGLLYYNCLSPIGDKFKPLVERYALLKNLPENVLFEKVTISAYSREAFEDRLRSEAAPSVIPQEPARVHYPGVVYNPKPPGLQRPDPPVGPPKKPTN